MKKFIYPLVVITVTAISIISPTTSHARVLAENIADYVTQGLTRSAEVKTTPFSANASYSICFTPGQDCEGLIVREIRHSQKSILLQAYSFTSAPIAKALIDAKQRGVEVRAILDKSQRKEKYSGAVFLQHAGIPTVIDERPAIAHSKILIFDQQTVLTGSFNFTKAAQERNAENLIIIRGDDNVVSKYTANWNDRWKLSVLFN
jgi:phosphatidylserine/phosphatidylglycerophosphate/cardiolipin synthase-like enzyme